VAEGADALVVLTEWNEFRALDLKRVRELMRGNVLVDLRNIYTETVAIEAGFAYHGVGRTPLPTITSVQKQRRKSWPSNIPQVTH
jgi:UDPglucose 6-dehydrogenase